MNRSLTWINFTGVFLLAALAVVQWRFNRQSNLRAIELEKIGHEQRVKVAEQDKTISGQAADLDTFREQLTKTHATLKATENRLAITESEIRQLSAERDQLKVSVTNWAAAVTARDEQLRLANIALKKLGDERNEVVGKFNELAAKYNLVVEDLNEARTRIAGANTPTSPPPAK